MSADRGPDRYHLLLVEDNPGDVDLVREYLTDVDEEVSLEVSGNLNEALDTLDRDEFTAILLDLNLPDSGGIETLDRIIASHTSAPVIVLTGADGDQIGLDAVAHGAADFLSKAELSGKLLLRSVRYAVERSQRHQERVQFQADVLDAVGQAIIVTDVDGRVIYWNRAAEELYGWSREDAVGRSVLETTPTESMREKTEEIFGSLRAGGTWTGEFEVRHRDGSLIHVLVTYSPMFDPKRRLVGIIGLSSDITERKQLEAQLRQAQKMEAIGRLAGGVAHDFNNLLTAIEGHATLLLSEMAEASSLRRDVEDIRKAGHRAADLTRQLLAFSRKQILEEQKVDLIHTTVELETMLRRLVPERISVESRASAGEVVVRADPGQLQQIVMNLVMNAADAIEDSGTITLQVDAVDLSPREVAAIPWHVDPGPYARLTVQDTGTGMSQEEMRHIFEPFFTTKPLGRGTGLGLATVFGVVKQSGGHILVTSTPGCGTTFQVLLPRLDEEPDRLEAPETHLLRSSESRVLLLVEDDAAVRAVTRRILERAGYTVLEADSGRGALDVADRNRGAIDLVISDVVMPNLGGVELQKRLKEDHPDLKVILMSGYSEAEVRAEIREAGAAFLSKPFLPDALLRVVGTALCE